MTDEPTGAATDVTGWPEARPPHLPDRLTSMSPWVLPFLIVAVYQFSLLWVVQPIGSDLATTLPYWFGARFEYVGIAASLIGLALFLRHPDANSTLPRIASGAFLLLLYQVLVLLQPMLGELFVATTPPTNDLYYYSPLEQAYRLLASLVWGVGVAFLASGLAAARRYENAGASRRFAIPLVLVAVVASIVSVIGYAYQALAFNTQDGAVVLISVTMIVNLLGALASTYVFVVALSGWLGQELPPAGWGLAALGAGLLLLERLLVPLIGLIPASQEVVLRIFDWLVVGQLLGWAALVVAFAIGLPRTGSAPDPEQPELARADPPATTPRDFAEG